MGINRSYKEFYRRITSTFSCCVSTEFKLFGSLNKCILFLSTIWNWLHVYKSGWNTRTRSTVKKPLNPWKHRSHSPHIIVDHFSADIPHRCSVSRSSQSIAFIIIELFQLASVGWSCTFTSRGHGVILVFWVIYFKLVSLSLDYISVIGKLFWS